ncbi:hypothetical protein [Micromonospora sp. CB01531]|uniref:hypothetical protein n=1 Tax=Micromonospora sp. CB01531 TaxID=1718947 RepID=UPI000939E574|nr:hypothetical protein [Micromonospora sp. CB01531]OKI64319.1 hypothetical protein A6A27_25330 [Micromonospora sp. CB01531]
MNGDGVAAAGADGSVAASSGHLPLRPLWLCRACGQPWPCGRAKLDLLGSYQGSRLNLLVYLAGLLHEAIDDLYRLNPSTGGDVRDLFDRFLGWPTRNRGCHPSSTSHPQTPEET